MSGRSKRGYLHRHRTGYSCYFYTFALMIFISFQQVGTVHQVPLESGVAQGTWIPTAPMIANRSGASATLLRDGTILVAGGFTGKFTSNGLNSSSAEIYNPRMDRWTKTAPLVSAVSGQTAVLLPDGTVLVVCSSVNSALLTPSAQLYSPHTRRWAATSPMHTARKGCTATLLATGLVLVAGGDGETSGLSSAELYNPRTHHWTFTGSMTTGREGHTATLLPNGTVLVAGGSDKPTFKPTLFANPTRDEIYDPRTGTWDSTRPMITLRGSHTATLLPNGTILVAGGGNNGFLSSAELYHVRTRAWTETGSMHEARSGHTATLLFNDTVLVTGGSTDTSAEIYVPQTGQWVETARMHMSHFGGTATLLPSGKVLVVGGTNTAGNLSGAELYNPLIRPSASTSE